MPQQCARHVVVVDPVQTGLGIDPWRKVGREEAVAVQAPGSHEDEDAEGRVREAQSPRFRLGVQPDREVYPVDLAVVDAP